MSVTIVHASEPHVVSLHGALDAAWRADTGTDA